VAPDDRSVSFEADLRFAKQSVELTIPVPAGPLPDALEQLVDDFRDEYAKRFGRGSIVLGTPIEMVSLRAVGVGRTTRAAVGDGSAAPVRPGQLRSATVWDGGKQQWTNPDPVTLAEDRRRGVVMVRPLPMGAREPVILHEMLHAYHAQMMPEGYQNSWVLGFYDRTKSNTLYPSDTYALTNEQEFFAVTASIFLYGQGDKEPFTRSNIKEKQPDYYRYLTWLFGLDPDRSPAAAPTASAPMADPARSSTQAAAVGTQPPVLTPPQLQLSGAPSRQ